MPKSASSSSSLSSLPKSLSKLSISEPGVTRQEVELVILLCLVYVSWGLTDSIQAPFYPIEAEEKGATSTQYGLVFGIIHLAMFVAGPVFGHCLPRLGVRPVLVFGLLGTALCACIFGLLGYFPSTWSFLGASYGLRVVEGVCEAGAWASVLTILGVVFTDRVTSVYSLTQAAFGFAEILGPSVGGVMFEVSMANSSKISSRRGIEFISHWTQDACVGGRLHLPVRV